MTAGLSTYFYMGLVDLYARDTKVFVADNLTSGAFLETANAFAHQQEDKKLIAATECAAPQAILDRYSVNSAEAAYFMARKAYNQAMDNTVARNHLGLAFTADAEHVYVAFACRSAFGAHAAPDVAVYKKPLSDGAVKNDIATASGAEILFNYASRDLIKTGDVTPVYKLPRPKLACAA